MHGMFIHITKSKIFYIKTCYIRLGRDLTCNKINAATILQALAHHSCCCRAIAARTKICYCKVISAAIKENKTLILLQHLFYFIAHETTALCWSSRYLNEWTVFLYSEYCQFYEIISNSDWQKCLQIFRNKFYKQQFCKMQWTSW